MHAAPDGIGKVVVRCVKTWAKSEKNQLLFMSKMPAETEEQPTQAVQEEDRPPSAKSESIKDAGANIADDKSVAGSHKSDGTDKDGAIAEADEEEQDGSQHSGENEDEELSDDALALKEELDKIRVATPTVEMYVDLIYNVLRKLQLAQLV